MLGAIVPGRKVCEAEGVEKALAIKAASPDAVVIASLGVSRLGKVALPDDCARIIVGDAKNDGDKALARKAAQAAAERTGKSVGLAFPSDGFGDIDEECAADGTDAVRAAIEKAELVLTATDLLKFPTDGAEPDPADLDYVIKGLIPRQSLGTCIGPSGVGKTTFAIDLAFHVALGLPYQGHRTRSGPVLYVGYEGLANLDRRISAAVHKFGMPGRSFARIMLPPSLNREQAKQGVESMLAAARQLEGAAGQACALIVIDTKARATAGDNEDSASDAAHYVEHAAGAIAAATRAAILTVHHTGKDETRGGRGSSALPAADDFRFKVSAEREVVIDKARDAETGNTLFSYDLKPVQLRVDAEGDKVTACVIEERAACPLGAKKSKQINSAQARRAMEVLESLYHDGKVVDVAAHEIGLSGIEPHRQPRVVLIDSWRDACRSKRLSDTGESAAEKKAFQRAVDALDRIGRIRRYDSYVWIPDQSRQDTSGHKADRVTSTRRQGQNLEGANASVLDLPADEETRDTSGQTETNVPNVSPAYRVATRGHSGTSPYRGCPDVPCPPMPDTEVACHGEDWAPPVMDDDEWNEETEPHA